MRALTVIPGRAGSAALTEVPEPGLEQGAVLVEALALGVCGTDVEISRGEYGWAPPGEERLILGHESLGRVLEAPSGALSSGDLVVGIVRRPDPQPCECCARGDWDFCRNGEYTERGIKALHGYGSERWRIEPGFAVKLDAGLEDVGVLMEPTSIVAKAWEQIERIAARASATPESVIVTGAGPIGLLAALLGVQRGLQVQVVDLVESGPKPDLVHALGAAYHGGSVGDLEPADVIIECTGVPQVIMDAMPNTTAPGIVCLAGVSPAGRTLEVDMGDLNRRLVLENDVVFGTVNANRRHYELAAEALARADREWLRRLITRRLPPDAWAQALDKRSDDIKVVLDFSLGR